MIFLYILSGFALGLCFTEMWDEKQFEKIRKSKNERIMELKLENDILKQVIRNKGYKQTTFLNK